jgi:uncharacterized membrane protein
MATSGDDHRAGRNRHGDSHGERHRDVEGDGHGDDHGDTGRWVTLGEAARALQVSRSAIYGRIGRGTLQMRRNGNRGTLVFLTSSMTSADRHGERHPDVDRDVTVTALRAENIELREALARVTAEREAARAVALADVAAAKRVAEAEIAAQIAASLTKEAVLRELVTELKAMLDEARRPWWQRLLGR